MRGSSGRGTPGWMGTRECLSRPRVGAYGAARGPADAEMVSARLATVAVADPDGIGTPGAGWSGGDLVRMAECG